MYVNKCPRCNVDLPSESLFCPKCGNETVKGDNARLASYVKITLMPIGI